MIYDYYARDKVCSTEKYSILIISDIMHCSWQFSFVRQVTYFILQRSKIPALANGTCFITENIKINFFGIGIFSFNTCLNFTLSRPLLPTKTNKQSPNPQTCFGILFCANDYSGFSHINHRQSELIDLLHSPIKFSPLGWYGDNLGKRRLKKTLPPSR